MWQKKSYHTMGSQKSLTQLCIDFQRLLGNPWFILRTMPVWLSQSFGSKLNDEEL